ncbi:MAG: hypothetical protein WC480_02630 [Patescibacteria group bacterium]
MFEDVNSGAKEPLDILDGVDRAPLNKTPMPQSPRPMTPPAPAGSPSQSPLTEPPTAGSGKKIIIIIAAVVLLLIILVVAGWVFYQKFFGEISGPISNSVTNLNTSNGYNQTNTGAMVNLEDSTGITNTATPVVTDSDADGLSDEREAQLGTDLLSADSDLDGLFDKEEVDIYQTDPLNPDTDGDGYKDGQEVKGGFDPSGPGKLFDANKTSTNEVCCHSYGFGSQMVRCCDKYEMMDASQCTVPQDFVGGGKEIVADSFCQ